MEKCLCLKANNTRRLWITCTELLLGFIVLWFGKAVVSVSLLARKNYKEWNSKINSDLKNFLFTAEAQTSR